MPTFQNIEDVKV